MNSALYISYMFKELSYYVRLGFLIDFLSHAAVVGFMGGAAITIALQQLKGFLGIKEFTKKTDIISVLHSVFKSAKHGVCSFFFPLMAHIYEPTTYSVQHKAKPPMK